MFLNQYTHRNKVIFLLKSKFTKYKVYKYDAKKQKNRKNLFAFLYVFYLIKTSTKRKLFYEWVLVKGINREIKSERRMKIDHLIVFVISSVPHTLICIIIKKCGQSRLFFFISLTHLFIHGKKKARKQIDTNIGRCFSYQFTFC